MTEHLLETWSIHNRINLYLLDSLAEEHLTADMAGNGRTVWALFAHIHNVRLMWLKSAGEDLLAGLNKLESKPVGAKDQLAAALIASGEAIAKLLERSLESGKRISGFKPHTVGFLGYLISHESHHRGQIEWTLRLAGTPISDKVSFGLWEWGSR